jgi:hypothetical protein
MTSRRLLHSYSIIFVVSNAEEAARRWVYKTATLNGVPIKTEAALPYTFAPGAQ